MEEICQNCHFLSKEFRDRSGAASAFSLSDKERAAISAGDIDFIASHYSLKCQMGVWDEGVKPGTGDRPERLNTINRKDKCFFFPHNPGMLFSAAIELQKRTMSNHKETRAAPTLRENSMKKIFISHASEDKALVDIFIDLLDTGTQLTQNDIFCSSVKGMGIPNYKEFVENIKNNLKEAQLVIVILSRKFVASGFCNCELGATWFAQKNCFALVVPPLRFEDVEGVMAGKQVGMITDSSALDELKDCLKTTLSVEAVTSRWNEKKTGFLQLAGPLIQAIPKSEKVVQDASSTHKFHQSRSPIDFTEVADSFVKLFPMLYWLDQVVPAKFAGTYFDRMQSTFNLSNGVFAGTDESLIFAIDNLLRVLSQIQKSEDYCHGKMCAAYRDLATYLTAHGESIPPFKDGDTQVLAHEARCILSLNLRNHTKRDGMDFYVMRLLEALLSYLDGISRDTLYKDVERDVQHSLRLYLEKGLLLNFNLSLPLISELDDIKRLQSLCVYKWEKSVEVRKDDDFKDKYKK